MYLRVVNYYQACTDPDFAHHMIEETGLSERDKKIAWSFRRTTGNSQYYADLAGLPIKAFNAVCAGIHRRMMDELLRLALIGWRAEKHK